MSKYDPAKHEWGTDAAAERAQELTPGEKKKLKRFKKFSEDYIAESFDKPYPYKLSKKGSGSDYEGWFQTDSGDRVRVGFERYDHMEEEGEYQWDIEFARSGKGGEFSTDQTDQGDAMRIFATVMEVMRDFIRKEKPNYLSFSASKKTIVMRKDKDKLQSREKLYLRMVKRYMREYKVTLSTSKVGTVFYLEKKNKN